MPNNKILLVLILSIMLISCLLSCGSPTEDNIETSASEETAEISSDAGNETGITESFPVQGSAMVPVETEDPPPTDPENPAEDSGDIPEEGADLPSVSEDTAKDEEPAAADSPDDNTENTEDNMDNEIKETSSNEGTFTSEPIPDEVFQRMKGVSFPDSCTIARDDLRYLRLSYHDFNGQSRLGELVCHKKVADDMTEIFRELYKRGYQIDKMRLIDDYGGDDDLSCADNNTSCFNYRTVAGSSSLSKHAMGVAIDINPFYNPYVTYPGGVERISPPGSEPYAVRSSDFPHKIGPGDDAYELFKAHGFTWGGDWKSLKDYQHFQKPL